MVRSRRAISRSWKSEPADFHQFGQSNPDLGVKKLDTHRSPVIGPRLIGKNADGTGPGGPDHRFAARDLSLQEDSHRG